MTAGRRLHLGLHLLDRQLVDRAQELCGKVDDVELTEGETGDLLVTALLSGPGVLSARLRAPWGRWIVSAHRRLAGGAPERIPMTDVADLGATIRLGVSRRGLGNQAGERWVASHVTSHIPGSGHAPE